MHSAFLNSRHEICRELVSRLSGEFEYVSVLGKHITGDRIVVSTRQTAVNETGEKQCGFVVKIFNGKYYSEYSFSDVTPESIDSLTEEIRASVKLSVKLKNMHASVKAIPDEPLQKDFCRPIQGKEYSIPEVIEELTAIRDKVTAASSKIIEAQLIFNRYQVSSFFVSKNRDLTQDYGWCGVYTYAVSRDGEKIQEAMDSTACNSCEEVFRTLSGKAADLGKLAEDMLQAEMIEPGYYDIISAPSISGLIAHEAFGHGVEMDMFVKNRAKAKYYVGEYVASPLVNMHDGAGIRVPAVPSDRPCKLDGAGPDDFMNDPCVGYFFDDDGVLAHDTLIIKDGILQTGISDAVSATQLGTEPTGNGRREDPSHKAYTRMTNTFFAPGESNLSDMIASIEHGYMLFDTNNGMEDPKNWNIQCVCMYGKEIKDGKFTGKIVAPVVMSGYVPDLLKSVSAVSKEWQIIGSGHCGKGYKEWVPVSDGGPYLKAKCKLG